MVATQTIRVSAVGQEGTEENFRKWAANLYIDGAFTKTTGVRSLIYRVRCRSDLSIQPSMIPFCLMMKNSYAGTSKTSPNLHLKQTEQKKRKQAYVDMLEAWPKACPYQE